MKHKQTRSEQKIEQDNHYSEMETRKPPDSARKQMQHEAYQSIGVIDYIRKIYKGSDDNGQGSDKKRK